MVGMRGTTDLKCVVTPSVKWCHVLRRAHFEAKTIPNLVPRVARCWNVWPHLGHILDHLSNEPLMREFIAPLCVKTHSYAIALLSSDSRYCIDINGYVIVLKQHF